MDGNNIMDCYEYMNQGIGERLKNNNIVYKYYYYIYSAINNDYDVDKLEDYLRESVENSGYQDPL